MSTHVIPVTAVLSDDERAAIDAWTAVHRGLAGLPGLQAFLAQQMAVDLVLDPDIVEGFSEDSSHLPHAADGVCRPRTERECAAILRVCSGAGIPVTLSGGRSNLTGSATPEGGVVLSTVRMTEPGVTHDTATDRFTAPVGSILEDVRTAIVEQSGGTRCLPVDPTSRADASLGGALACNASGFTPGETGAIRAWVHRLRLMLSDGRVIDAARGQYISEDGCFVLADGDAQTRWPVPRYPRPRIKNAGGPFSAADGRVDLVDLAVGSEGIFGLVTACELESAPRPNDYLDLFFSLPDEGEALKMLEHVTRQLAGELSRLSAFEYFGENCRRTMDHETRFFKGDDRVGIYLQQPLYGESVEDAAGEWLDILTASGCKLDADAILLLDSESLRALFLEARHSLPANALEVVKRRGTYTIMTDTVVPPDRFREFLAFTHGRLAACGLDYVAFGHLGDCHLHFTLLPEQAQLEAGVEAYDAIVAKSAELGGVYSGEHGTGKRKRQDFLRCYGADAVAQVRACKAAVDPRFVLNCGNVFDAREMSC